ncbi:unnamed protein product [Albugo candida]|uniref:Calcineurin-like phosphoesterase domain-containing protein n=1 Tax=Albugo candida TaxID=65357 RepID=A0A024FUE7_9STRA|nr:unnamed protein product [Albugo candida]|eukprot:CCI10783.1 unnamed protein product [Albugo candida]
MRPPKTLSTKTILSKLDPVKIKEDVEEREIEFKRTVGNTIISSLVTVMQKRKRSEKKHPKKFYRKVTMAISKKRPAEENVVRFIVLGNAGIPNYHVGMKFEGIHAAIGDKLVSLKDNIDFVVMTGDNFLGKGVWGCDDPQWEKVWFERLKVEELGVPWFTVLGDRDMLGDASTQYNFHKCEGKERMSKYWITPSENYLLVIDETVKMLFVNTNRKKSKVSRWIRKNRPNIVVGHHFIPQKSQGEGQAVENFITYISGHEPVLKHVKEGKTSYIVVGTSGDLMTYSFSDCPNAVTMDGMDGCGNGPTEHYNHKSYGFALITVAKDDNAKQVELHTYHHYENGRSHWDVQIG